MSMRFTGFTILAFALLLGCGSQSGGEAASATDSGSAAATESDAASGDATAGDADVAARIGGEVISVEDLDDFIKQELWDRETGNGNVAKTFEVRNDAVDRMLRLRVLEAEAARRNTTADGLVMGEMAASAVSDEEVQQFYDERVDQMGGMSVEQVGPRIRQYLEQKRAIEYVESLLEAEDAEVLLEAPRVDVAADGPAKGPEDAAVTIIEFSDFQCPFCSRSLPVIAELLERYPEDVRVVYRHLPLENIHPRARIAAEASMCADDQGEFWAYHDLLFQNSAALADADLRGYAETVGIDAEAWQACMDEQKFASKVTADLEAGQAVGISGTPAFVINGRLLTGARPVEDFVRVIDAEIARSGGTDAG